MEADVRSPACLDTYTERLNGSLPDKLFFAHRIPRDVTVFADFGCADGALLRALHVERHEARHEAETYIGYDHNPAMIDKAKQVRDMGRFEWSSSYELFAARIERHRNLGHKVCLILSSVVHEVLSQRPGEFIPFWHRLTQLGCEYIVVRDMAVAAVTTRASMSEATWEVWENCLDSPAFEKCWYAHTGRPSRSRMLEALIKHRYEDNLEAELEENYFPLTAEEWLTKPWGYRPVYYEHTPLPFLQDWWQERYGIWVPDPTHIKLIFQKDG